MIGRGMSFAALVAVIVLFALFSALSAVPANADLYVACAAAKQKAAAKLLSQKVKCYGTAMTKGEAVDPACLTKAEAKFNALIDATIGRGCTYFDMDGPGIASVVSDSLVAFLVMTPATPAEVCLLDPGGAGYYEPTCTSYVTDAGCATCVANAPESVGAACDAAVAAVSSCWNTNLNVACAMAVNSAGCASACCQ